MSTTILASGINKCAGGFGREGEPGGGAVHSADWGQRVCEVWAHLVLDTAEAAFLSYTNRVPFK